MNKKIILFLIIIMHLSFIFLSVRQLYYGDEVNFIEVAREVSQGQVTGHFGHLQGRLIEDKSNMLMHPPTYIYLLAIFISIFGENTYSTRLPSALFSIGIIILIFLITKRILEKRNPENAETWALIAAFLYAINPFAIQSSILVDIDGGLLNFFILLFFYFYISNKNLIFLISSLFMIFASKLIGPVMLFASLFLLNLGARDFKELKKIIKLFMISGILFFLIFFLYCKFFGLSWNSLFSHNSASVAIKNLFINTYLTLARSLWGFKNFFYFATPFLIFLFIIISLRILISAITNKNYLGENKDIVLLWLFSLIMISFLMTLPGNAGWNFPKYYIITLPSLIILVVYFTPKNIKNLKKALPIIILTCILLLFYFMIFLKDPLMQEVKGRVKTLLISEVIKPVLTRFFLYSIIPIFLCIGLFKRIPVRKLWLVLFFLLIFTSIYLDIIQAKADYSTHNLYGDKGLKEVIEFMKDKPPSQILCYVHVGYFLNYKNTYELTTLYYDTPNLIKTINEKGIQWIILYQKDIDLIGNEILKDFELEKEFGDYKILKKK